MKRRNIITLDTDAYEVKKEGVGFGTRPSAVIMQHNGRRQYLVKGFNKSVGELRSEYCASILGRLGGFPVQEVELCRIGNKLHGELITTSHYDGGKIAVKAKIDVRRRKDKSKGHVDLEEMLHGTNLIDSVVKSYSSLTPNERRHKYTLQNIERALDFFETKHPEAKGKLKEEFFKQTVFDAWIGGTERHDYNWGVLLSVPRRKYIRMVKYYDNGISLLWNMDTIHSLKNRILFDPSREAYVRKGQSMIRNHNGHRLKLFEVCVILKERGYCSDQGLKDIIAHLSHLSGGLVLKHAIVDQVPLDDQFGMREGVLGWLYHYVEYRLEKLIKVLEE